VVEYFRLGGGKFTFIDQLVVKITLIDQLLMKFTLINQLVVKSTLIDWYVGDKDYAY